MLEKEKASVSFILSEPSSNYDPSVWRWIIGQFEWMRNQVGYSYQISSEWEDECVLTKFFQPSMPDIQHNFKKESNCDRSSISPNPLKETSLQTPTTSKTYWKQINFLPHVDR